MSRADEIIEQMGQFETDRANFDQLYQDATDFAMPQNNQIIDENSAGEPKEDLFDTTAEESNIQLASGLYSYMFPTEGRAFVLEIDDDELSDNDDVKQWLEKTTKVIHKYLISSTFRESFFGFLKALGVFGTACLYEAKGKKSVINFINYFMRDIYIARNSDDDVDTVYRRFKFTARQAVQEFGIDNVGEKIKEAFGDSKKRNKKFNFIHAVEPRSDRDPKKEDPQNMPFSSEYVARDEKIIINTKSGKESSGYPELPYQIGVFDRDNMEDLGRSPTMKKLPDIRMANKLKQIRVKGWDKMVDPTVMMPDDGSIWPLATQPGGVIFYRAGGEKPEYWEFKGNLSEINSAISETITTIQKGYFVDMFDPLIDKQNMTATEIMARVEQKLRFLIPIIGRLQSGLFNPMIQRVIGILAKQKKLPPMPEELSEKEFSVMYLGRIALSLRTLEVEGMTKTLMAFAPLADMNILDWLDNIQIDESFRESWRANGASAAWLKNVADRDTERQAKAEVAAAQEQMAAMPDMMKAAKAGGSKPEDGSPTAEVMNAL